MTKSYELVPHTADHKIYAYGFTLQELFTNALKGMFASIKPISGYITYTDDEPQVSHYTAKRHAVVQSADKESLLVDFLSEAVYQSDLHNEAYLDVKFAFLDETNADATLYGVAILGYELSEIKAVTYHDLTFEQINGQWRATLVFDI